MISIPTLLRYYEHGRHGANIKKGFKSNGDSSPDCRHINFYATGPDIIQNKELEVTRSQIAIAPTVAELLHFEMPYAKNDIMYELF